MSCVAILLLLLSGLPASAAEVTPLEKGQPAPFAGMLYPVENAIAVSKKAERCDFVLDAEKKKNVRLVEVETVLCARKLVLEREATDMKLEVVKKASISPVAMTIAVVGAYVGGVATIILSAWVVGQLPGRN